MVQKKNTKFVHPIWGLVESKKIKNLISEILETFLILKVGNLIF